MSVSPQRCIMVGKSAMSAVPAIARQGERKTRHWNAAAHREEDEIDRRVQVVRASAPRTPIHPARRSGNPGE